MIFGEAGFFKEFANGGLLGGFTGFYFAARGEPEFAVVSAFGGRSGGVIGADEEDLFIFVD